MIYQIHLDHPDWTLQMIADLVGVSRQWVYSIVKKCETYGIIATMENKALQLDLKTPISATQASKITGIPYYAFEKWVRRGLVKIVSRPDRRACTGQSVLLDPVSLQERINRYRPRQKKTPISA
jgi:hypothetical protein